MSTKNRKGWGGARPGAGRPKGSGRGPSPLARKNRISVMLSDPELAALEALARDAGKATASFAYELLARALRGRVRRAR